MQGLDSILQKKDLNAATFNLVFGNAILHHKERHLIERLEEAKADLAKRIDATKTDDDTKIFSQLKDMKLDWQNWTMIEDRKINSWNIQLNKFRMLKPKRVSLLPITNIYKKFDEAAFNFNKISVPAIWKGLVSNREISLYYNEYPFKDLQSLLILDPQLNKPQFLTKPDHMYVWEFCQSLKNLYNLVLGYNSLGAYASVNHLHFHLMIGIEQITVTENKWRHNGGQEVYPVPLHVFNEVMQAWNFIEALHTKNIAYNLLYMPGKVYVYPRKFQGTYTEPSWTSGLGWYEFSGNFIVYEEDEVNALTDGEIRDALNNASITI